MTGLPDVAADARSVRASRRRHEDARVWVIRWHVCHGARRFADQMGIMAEAAVTVTAQIEDLSATIEVEDLWRTA